MSEPDQVTDLPAFSSASLPSFSKGQTMTGSLGPSCFSIGVAGQALGPPGQLLKSAVKSPLLVVPPLSLPVTVHLWTPVSLGSLTFPVHSLPPGPAVAGVMT